MKKLFFLFPLIGLIFLPFGKWRALDDVRFDCIDSLARLKFYGGSPYNAKNLSEKIKAPSASWVAEQIAKDLEHLSPDQLSEKALDAYMGKFSTTDLQNKHLLIRITLKNGKFQYYPEKLNRFQGRLASVQKALEILNKEDVLPQKLDFILCINDKIFEEYDGTVPIFVFSKNVADPKQKNLVMIPDGMNLSRWAYNYTTIRFANFVFPWEKKRVQVLWRGSNTNPIREKLVQQSSSLSFVDAAMTDGRDKDYMIPEYQIQFKYLLSLDGISSTWPGLLWKLASNSLVFKQASVHKQWYYSGIRADVHYVEVKDDLSNLEVQYNWAQSHSAEAKKISQNAQEFVKNNLTYEDMLCYMGKVFEAYSKRNEESL